MSGTVSYNTYARDIPSQAVSFASSIVADRRDNYLLFASGESAYTLICYDSITSGGDFSNADCFTFTRISPVGGVPYWDIHSNSDVTAHVSILDSAVKYSSKGDFPRLREGGLQYDFAQTVLLAAVLLFSIIDRIFRHTGVPR